MDNDLHLERLLQTIKELTFQNTEKDRDIERLTLANSELQHTESNYQSLNTELESRVMKRTAQYAFISQVNQAIVQAKDLETVFKNSCRIAIQFGKFKMAWIGRFDSTYKKINLLHSSGLSVEDIKLFTNVSYEANGPQDYVLRTGKLYLCNDIDNDLKLKQWKPIAAKYDIRSCIVLPIKKSDITFGTFNLYATELNFFSKEDIELLSEVTRDISFSLSFFEKAQKHHDAEEIIIKNEKRFRALIENSSDMITLSSREGKMLYGSPSITKLFGYTHKEILNTSAYDFIHPDDIDEFSAHRIKLLELPGQSYHTKIRLKHKKGNWIWCESTLTNRLHDPGIEAMVSNFRDISDKKLIEQQQEFDNNNLNALINNTTDLMWSVDRDFNLITSNQPFDELGRVSFGKTIAKGENVLSVSDTPEMLIHFKQLYERAFKGEAFMETSYFDYPEELWTEISYHPIRKDDEIIGTACHSRDLTSVKKIERQLIKSEAFNRGVLDSLYSNISVINNSGEIIAVNESWTKFSVDNGSTNLQGTCTGANYFKVCEKSAQEGNEIAYEVLLGINEILSEKQKSFYLEYPCHSPNEQRWFGMHGMKFESDVSMIVLEHMDITERKLAEENLVQSEARLKEAQALAHICNWEVDLISGVNTWSDEFYAIYGLGRDEIKPSPEGFLSLIHPDDIEFAQTSLKNTFQSFDAGSLNTRIKKRDGAIRYIYTEWKFEFDKNKKPIRLFGILQDITDRKTAEQEREKLTTDLIKHNRDLEQFTFIISHNLRAPTANIIGFTEHLQDETLTPQEHKELLNGLATSVSALDDTIKDINSILQVKHELTQKRELISFSGLVNSIFISIGKIIGKYNAVIESDFTAIDEMFSLKVYMHSIFFNLISNSIKYSKPDEPPHIEIKSQKVDNKIILTFKDNGLGIDMKTKSNKVFGLYNRFHSHVEGKGIGLFMVKSQVEAIGGKISVTSQENIGTEFTIVFDN